MNKFRFTLKILAIAIFTFAFASLAQAQATRTWVSGVGDDVNPCSRTAPCKTFAGAISKTAAGGEIDALDPGGFGAVTATKSITLDGTHGAGFGSILASGVTGGVIVNDSASATPNTAVVRLHSLSINGAGNPTGQNGIRFIAGKALHVEDCQIFNFRSGTGRGISVELTANASQRVTVHNTTIYDNSGEGLRAANTAVGGAVNIMIDGCNFIKNNIGVSVTAVSVVNIRNSTFSFNPTGVQVSNASSSANLEDCFIQDSSTHGIQATAGNVRLRGNHVTNNNNGLTCAGGTISSYGDNAVQGNGVPLNGCPDPLPPLAKK